MGIPTLPGSVFSGIVRTAEYLLNRKSRQRREAEAASQLVSVLDRFVVDCDAVVTDDGTHPLPILNITITVNELRSVRRFVWPCLISLAESCCPSASVTECAPLKACKTTRPEH